MTDIKVSTYYEIDWKDDPRRRDMFAMAALTGLLASWPPNGSLGIDETANQAAAFADATITRLDATAEVEP